MRSVRQTVRDHPAKAAARAERLLALRLLELPRCSVDMEQPHFMIDAEPPGGRLCRISCISFVCLIYPTYFMPLSSVLVQLSKNVLSHSLKSAVRSA